MRMPYHEYIQQVTFTVSPRNAWLLRMSLATIWLKNYTYSRYNRTGVRFFSTLSHHLQQLQFHIEVANAKLPEDDLLMKNRLRELLTVPRMSTFAIGAILNKGVSMLREDCCFVNVGVWHGFTFLAALKENPDKICIGIDNFSQWSGAEDGNPQVQFQQRFERYKSARHEFYNMDYREYFRAHHSRKIGLYMYDGHHGYEHQLEGLRLAEPFFADECFVIVDDTNWEHPRQATLDFIAQSSKRYVILLDQQTYKHSHPTLWCGLMVFQQIKS